MRKNHIRGLRRRVLGGLCASAMIFQFGGCEFGEISLTSTTVVNGREVLIDLARSAILGPIDAFLTNAINQAFGTDDE